MIRLEIPFRRSGTSEPVPKSIIEKMNSTPYSITSYGFAIAVKPDYTLVAAGNGKRLLIGAIGSTYKNPRYIVDLAIINKHRIGLTFLKCGLGLFFASQVVLGMPNLQSEVQPFLTVPNLPYAEKMRIQWGAIFDQMDFIRRETPENAVILMKVDGRPEFDQYFLFPRRVIYGDANALLNYPSIDYVLIDGGYPQFPVLGSKIMMDDKYGLYELQR